MRHTILAIGLLMVMSHTAWAGPEMMMAVMGQRSTGSSAFSGVYDGWVSSETGLLYLSSAVVHSAGSAILYPDFATNTQTLTQHIYSNGGYLTVWARTPSVSSAVSTITPYIDTVAQDTLNSNTPNTWQQFSIPITQGWHDVVFQFTRATTGTGDVYLDDIVVP